MIRDIVTMTELKSLVGQTGVTVYGQIRFGSSEQNLKIPKTQVYLLLSDYSDDASPEDADMYGSVFGQYDDVTKCLYLG